MSVIQTIRNKYLGLMIGAIVIALLGFLFMDAFTHNKGGGSLFGGDDKSTIGSINGEKINNQEFSTLLAKYEDNAKGKSGKLDDATKNELQDQAWNDLLSQKLLTDEYTKLGITVSDKELQDMLTGPYAEDIVKKNFTDPNTGIFDPTKVKEYLRQLSSEKDENKKKQWREFEKGLIDQRLSQKYSSLVGAGIYTPKAVVDELTAQRNLHSSVNYVSVPYTSIEDSKVPVTDAELTDYMKAHPTLFTLEEPLRKIEYVNFDITPSTEDTAKSLGVINTLHNDFVAASGDNLETLINKNSDETFDAKYYAHGTMPSKNMDTVIGSAVGAVVGPYYDNGYFKLTKILDKKSIPDSVKASHIVISINQNMSEENAKIKIDSIEKAYKNGASIESLASISDDTRSKTKGGDIGFFTKGNTGMGDEFEAFCFENGHTGESKVIKTNGFYDFVKITDQKAFKASTKMATLSKSLTASENTVNTVFAKANAFASKVTDKASFEAQVKALNVNKKVGEAIRENQKEIKGLGNAREVVKWAYDAKVGAASGVINLSDKCVIATLTDVSPKGLAPASLVRTQLEPEVRRLKKAKMIADQYKGQTLDAIAAKVGGPVKSADSLTMAGNQTVFGYEPKIQGAAFNKTGINKVSTGIAGQQGVYFINIKAITPAPSTAPANYNQERQMQQMQVMQGMKNMLPATLRKRATIQDNRSIFM